MGSCTVQVSLIFLHLLLFTLFTCSPTAFCSSNSTIAPLYNIDGSPYCALIDCGHGKCVLSPGSYYGLDCECNPGWKKMQLGLATVPTCILPNCTVNLDCGNGAPPAAAPTPPPPSSFPLPTVPCDGVWCGEGTCISNNGSQHRCQCNEGSTNLYNKNDLACFKPCSLGADCYTLGLGSPPSSSTSPTTPGPAVENGTSRATNSSGKLRSLTMTLLAATFLSWL